MAQATTLSGVERHFHRDDIIVSKTDLKGRITYANKVFLQVAGYTEREVLEQPHSMIRHPDMPRCVFKLLWDTLAQGQEIFAYVVNRAKNGDHYWVLAHVTPSFDTSGAITGYHSNRRVPEPAIIGEHIVPLYRTLCQIEASEPNRKDGMNKAFQAVLAFLGEKGMAYDEYVLTVGQKNRRGYR